MPAICSGGSNLTAVALPPAVGLASGSIITLDQLCTCVHGGPKKPRPRTRECNTMYAPKCSAAANAKGVLHTGNCNWTRTLHVSDRRLPAAQQRAPQLSTANRHLCTGQKRDAVGASTSSICKYATLTRHSAWPNTRGQARSDACMCAELPDSALDGLPHNAC